ncbi:MAG: type II toxin-antitoxin system VapC family toxin [Verrucomicrobiales bacterium]|nr:type II toxin-antitoxin system VapC family toxin [Verrucomicrobiales bacterium]
MGSTVYWDTSALLKIYAAETDSSDYLKLLISQPGDIAVSYLHRVELYYALCGKETRGEIQAGAAKTLFASFESHIADQRYWEIPWGSDVLEEAQSALDVSLSSSPPIGLRTLDGLHLGAMLAAKVTTLVTADNRMRDAAAGLRITCVNP